MRGKINTILRKTFALIISVVMSVPTGVFAAENQGKVYDKNTSVMGLAENKAPDTEIGAQDKSQIEKDLDNYKVTMTARLDQSLEKIHYQIRLSKKEIKAQDEKEREKDHKDISINLGLNPNSSINAIRLLSAKENFTNPTDIQTETKDIDQNDPIKSLTITTKDYDEIIMDFEADVRKMMDKRTYDLLVSLKEDEKIDSFTYGLKAEKTIEVQDDRQVEKIDLLADQEAHNNIKGEYISEGFIKFLQTKDSILWTDFIANHDKEKSLITYDFNLDQNQDSKDSTVDIDYFENTGTGYILKKEYSQSIAFAKKIELEIPAGFIAKLSLKTKVDKKNTAIKNYSLNNRVVKNPIYIEGNNDKEKTDESEDPAPAEKPAENLEKENKDQKTAQDKNPEANEPTKTEENKEAPKTQPETKDDLKESNTEIKAEDSTGKDIPVEVKEKEKKEEKNDQPQISALILNRDGLISKLEKENKLDDSKKTAIDELASRLVSYNDEKITYQELLDYTKSIGERYGIEKADLGYFIDSMIAGLNQNTNKAAKLESKFILDYAYPEKPETENKAPEKTEPEEKSQDKISGDKTDQNKDQEKESTNKDQNQKDNSSPAQNKTAETKTETKQETAVETFDKDLEKLKEDAKNTKGDKNGLVEGIKGLFGQTDLQKADKELKKALADEKNGLEEIQNLLDSFEKKYKLSKADQAKLMDDNGDAIKKLIAKDGNENFRPSMFFSNPVGSSPNDLENKKFTIRTRLDTSTITGPIQPGQYFEIKLDPRLTVKSGTTLPNIVNDGTVLATPEYIPGTNTIKYTVKNPIAKNLQIPLNIDVDYDVKKITELDGIKDTHTINNSISGLGVIKPVKLPEVIVNNNGDVINGITEPDSHDVLQIVEPGSDYQVSMDAHGSPVVKNGKLVAVKWSVRFTSTKDLLNLGLSSNATTVKGSGLGNLSNLMLNGEEIKTKNDGLSTNEIEGKLGIVSSKNHTLKKSTREVLYTFQTNITNPQEKYALDLSVALNNIKKTGAVRLVYDAADAKTYIDDTTSKRAGINNRTTIFGEFTSERTARWTVTDQVSTGDENNGLPLAKRELGGDQDLKSAKMAVYGLNEADGKMVVKQGETDLSNKIPDKETNPNEKQLPGRIAVYEFDTDINDSEAGYSLSGVNINKYQPIKIKQSWAGIDYTKNMPGQTIKVQDSDENDLTYPLSVSEGTRGESSREFNLPAVKTWKIGDDGSETKISPIIVQELPKSKQIGNKTYTYKEKYNYYSLQDKAYSIYNIMTESTNEKDADFIIVKTDSKDSTKKLPGAEFTLQSSREAYTLQTDENGQASFKNISPGTYTLIENKAPAGYKLDQSVKQITVSNDGKVSVTGNNISMQGGHIGTVTARHNYYPSYPSYMNAMHYGNIDQNGNIEFYIYLKPEADVNGGSTNKDTRLNLNIAGGGTISSVEAIDVGPNNRYNVRNQMQNQTAGTVSGSNVINASSQYSKTITGNDNVKEPFTGKTGYQIKFPSERFNKDWGFLVKVKATGGTSTSSVSYDWITDNPSYTNEARIQESIGLSTSKSTNTGKNDEVKLNITNEEFQKSPIEIYKLDENGVDALTGATFRLLDSNKNPVMDAQAVLTDSNPKESKAYFGKQSPGKYTIEEIKAPERYKKSNVVFDVNVTDDGKVTYKARFKDGNGTPINGIDYIIEDVEIGQGQDQTTVSVISQSMTLQEKQNQPDDGRIGWTEGVWEAYGIESYRYDGSFTIANAVKGGKLKIQFDPNLDFRRYVYEIPDLKDGDGNLLAKPYFNYDTNLLTYVFENNAANVNASMQIIGIIPDKYFATQTNNKSGYNFKITVDPDNPNVRNMNAAVSYPDKQTTASTNNILPVNIKTDYYSYDSQGGGGPLTSEYITDIYESDGNIYMKAVSYYNPTNMSSGQRTIRLDWMSMKKPRPGLEYYKAEGKPAFDFNDLKVYKVYGNQDTKQRLMPLSYGIRPEQDTSNYNRVYSKSIIDPNRGFSESGGDVRVTYRPEYIKSSEGLLDYGHEKHPLEIDLPRVSGNEGYVIVQTFKVTNETRFKELWSGYYLSNGNRHTGSYQKGNYNWALGSETGKEIPTFYSQKIKLINKKYTPGSFKIKKTNEVDNSNLPGAIFELKSTDGKYFNRVSGSDGIVEFNNLEPGIYTLVEAQAPKNFIKSNRRWQVVVYDTGDVIIREIGTGVPLSGKDTIVIPVSNKPVGEDFKIYKKDFAGKPLPGATFVVKNENDQILKTAKSNDNGVVEFKGLNKGTYIIEESEAPTGYKKLDKKWVLVIDDQGNKKIYNYREKADSTNPLNSIIEKEKVNWVNVAGRSLDGWNLYDNRRADWTGNYPKPFKLGTRIVAINKDENYVIQRYVINPEANDIKATTATIHREKLEYTNMDWFEGNASPNKDYQVYKLNKAITGPIADIRLSEYGAENITAQVSNSVKQVSGRYGEPMRMSLDLPATKTPIVVDIKVPYHQSSGGVGTGMDWVENGTTYWKSDYYERVDIIKESGPVLQESKGIQGSYIGEGSLDVNNEPKTYGFKIKKVKEDNTDQVVKGAEFKLTGPEPSTEERYMTTGSNGIISFDKLKAGTYKLVENKSAPGYEKSNVEWTVRITDEGRVFIKQDTNSARSPEKPNATVSVPDNQPEPTPQPAQAFRQAREFRSAMLRSAAIPEDDMGLEIGENIISNPVRAESDWEAVDPSKSEGRTNKTHTGNYMETKITEINKQDDRFRQIFLFKPGTRNFAGKIEIHREPESDLYLKLGNKEISNVKFYEVDATSTIGNITGKKELRITPRQERNGNGPMRIKATLQSNKTILVEVETSYAANGSLGLGADYEFGNKSGPYDNSKNSWAGDSYANEDGVNKNKEGKHKVNIDPNIQNGKVTSDKNEAANDEIVTLTVTPNPGYELESLTVAGVDATQAGQKGKVTVRMANKDINVTATFKKVVTYPVTIKPTQNGKVTSDKSQAKYGEDVTITVKADPGYRLKQLYINGPASDYTQAIYNGNGQMTFPMGNFRADVYAVFERDPNMAILSFAPNGGSGTMENVAVPKNKRYKIPECTFNPPPGKIFKTWDIYGYKYAPGSYATIDDDYTFTAEWQDAPVNLVSISVNSTNHKTNYKLGEPLDVTNLTIEASMSDGTTRTIDVTPDMVSGFDSSQATTNKLLTITYQGKTTSYNINVSKPEQTSHSIGVVPNRPNGSITAPTSARTGDKVTITSIKPDPEYELDKIEVQDRNGKVLATTDASNSFTMPDQDVYLMAYFKKKTSQQRYEIGIDGDPLRSVTVTPEKGISGQAEEGEKVNVSVRTNSPNYTLKSIFVKKPNGQLVDFVKTGPTTGYFIMPATDVTVYTTLSNIVAGSYEVKIVDSQNGYVNTDKVVAKPGETVTLTPVPAKGYKLGSYTVTYGLGNEITVTDNKFTMPNSPVNVKASFISEGTPTPSDKEIEIPEGKYAQITNEQTGIELKIFKKNSADAALQGAEFKLEKTNDDYTQIDTDFGEVIAESDQDGNVTFNKDGKAVKLKPGKYLLTETKSPAGYKQPAAPWKLQVVEEGGQLVIKESGPKHTSTSYLSSEGAQAGDNLNSTDKIKYKSIIKSIDPVNKTFIQRIYVDTRGYKGSDKINVQITPTTKREEIDTPSAPPETTKGGVKTAYRTTYKISNPGQNLTDEQIKEILNDYDLRKSDVSVINTARWRPFDWGFDEDQINLSNDGVYFIDIEGFYDDNIKDLKEIELKVDFYGGERIFAQRTFENGELGWKYDKDIGATGGLQTKRDAAYQQGMEALYAYYAYYYGEANAKAWFYGNSDNQKYAVWLRKGATINGRYYDAGRIVLASDTTDPNSYYNKNPIQTSYTKAKIEDLYSSDRVKNVPQDGMRITNEDETYNITFSKHARLETDPAKEDFNKNRLEGAVFKLQKKEGSFWYDVDNSYVASAFNGYFGFRRLEPGRYRLLEVTPPQGYKPIDGPLLEFTIKQIDTRSGKIINPRTKKEVDLIDLTIVDPYNQEKIALNSAKAKIKGDTTDAVYNFSDLVKDEKFNIDTCLILSEVKDERTKKPKEIPLKQANYLDPETNEPMGRIISGAQGYISLEYKPGGYVSEYGKAGSSGGSLVDYVTSATAKNMGKIMNEKPGKGKVTIKKLNEKGEALGANADSQGNLTAGAVFEATRISSKKGPDGKPTKDAVYSGMVNEKGILVIEGLPIGDYELKEVKNPSGQINTGQVWHFTVGGVGLDPYAGPIARTGSDLTDKISISKSEIKVIRPNAEDEKATGSEGNSVIRPHVGQSLEFDNEFSLDPTIEIKPGDYFVLKLSDNIDLEGVRTDGASNLDLFADGVGTIAKADYNKEAGTITYTFTKYAEQYKLLNFENKLAAHISLKNVRNSGDQKVGIGLGTDTSKYHDINVKYIVDTIEKTYDNATVNLASKIVEYNTKTGEFVHYFYINRDRRINSKDLYFEYKPSVNVEDLQLTYYKLKNNNDTYINQSMPESFAVNEYDWNLQPKGGTTPENVNANKTKTYNIGNIGPQGSMIVKVTGRMKKGEGEADILSYKGISGLYSKYEYKRKYDVYNDWGWYVGTKTETIIYNIPYVNRWDAIYAFDNTNTASADLTISAVNPTNKIQFKKVDPYGKEIKPDLDEKGELIKDEKGIVKGAAYFSLWENSGTAEKPTATWKTKGNPKPVDKDGIVSYEKLEEGYYKLTESTTPPGFLKQENSDIFFKVDDSGKIYQVFSIKNEKTNETEKVYKEVEGTIPINIINYKPVEFEKVDAADNTKKLKDAKFEVYYKEKLEDKYAEVKKDGETLTVKSDEKGKFKLDLTKDGYYALKEIETPTGYKKLDYTYAREFKLDKGRVYTLERDLAKGTLNVGKAGMITSQTIKVNKADGTFTQRLLINPKSIEWEFDGPDTQLRITPNGWDFDEDYNKGKFLRIAVLDNAKEVDKYQSFSDYNRKIDPRSYSLNAPTQIYTIRDMYDNRNYEEVQGNANIKTNKLLLVEFTGKLKDGQKLPVNIDIEILSYGIGKSIDKVSNILDRNNIMDDNKSIYVESKDSNLVQVENDKLHDIRFRKVDAKVGEDGKKKSLDGAEFKLLYKDKEDAEEWTELKLYEKDETVDSKTVTKKLWSLKAPEDKAYTENKNNFVASDKKGLVEFDNLSEPGYYAIQETKAPKDYALLTKDGIVKKFVIKDGKLIMLVDGKEGEKPKEYVQRDGVYYYSKEKLSDDDLMKIVREPSRNQPTDQNYVNIDYKLEINPDNKEIPYKDPKITLKIPEGMTGQLIINKAPKGEFANEVTPTMDKNGTIDLSSCFDEVKGKKGITDTKVIVTYRLKLNKDENDQKDIEIKSSLTGIGDRDIGVEDKFKYTKEGNQISDVEAYKRYVDKNLVNTDKTGFLEVENRKVELPKALGTGNIIAYTLAGLAVMIGGVFIYYKKKQAIKA
uniref:SpaA isopeptide-forming pilin-related protein n=1 Tax=Anaerococcus mediterraneensis TaxID=1870984 RepID=UPI00093165E3|nr:SpaA isopeptide-forming pilin-related protein [Anaerococcus mediterraneensis]